MLNGSLQTKRKKKLFVRFYFYFFLVQGFRAGVARLTRPKSRKQNHKTSKSRGAGGWGKLLSTAIDETRTAFNLSESKAVPVHKVAQDYQTATCLSI
uniref:Putative secreted protein n=1 Tax=Ixodes ricinus TaxID=34613 RepID=A0A147BFR5_IXORI